MLKTQEIWESFRRQHCVYNLPHRHETGWTYLGEKKLWEQERGSESWKHEKRKVWESNTGRASTQGCGWNESLLSRFVWKFPWQAYSSSRWNNLGYLSLKSPKLKPASLILMPSSLLWLDNLSILFSLRVLN